MDFSSPSIKRGLYKDWFNNQVNNAEVVEEIDMDL